MPQPWNSAPLELPMEELLPYRFGHVELLVDPMRLESTMHASSCPSVAPPDGTEAPTPAIRTYRRRVRTERDRNLTDVERRTNLRSTVRYPKVGHVH